MVELTNQLAYCLPGVDEYAKHVERIQPASRGESVSRKLARTDTTYFAVNQLGLQPYYWQSKMWDEILDGKNPMVCSARQVGKTSAVAIFALQAVLYNTMPLKTTKRTRIVIVSKSDAQSKKVISDIREWMRVCDDRVEKLTGGKIVGWATNQIKKGQDATNTKAVITLENGCEVISLPPTDSARGYTASVLLLDEVAFFPDEKTITQTLQPIVAQTGNRIIPISTPNGQQGYFFKHFDPYNKYKEHDFVRIWVPYTALALDDPQLVFQRDAMRKSAIATGDEREFEQEHMASFNASAESFFNPDAVDRAIVGERAMYEAHTEPCDLAVDFGVGKHSRTVMTISTKLLRTDKKGKKEEYIRQLYQYEYPPDKDLELVVDIQKLMKSFNLQRIIFEDCGAAEAHRQAAERIGLPIFMFNPSRDKSKKYFSFRAWLNRGCVELLPLPEQTAQLKGMILENTASGRTKIYHGSGLRDDRADSLMMSTAYYTEEESTFRVWDWDDV